MLLFISQKANMVLHINTARTFFLFVSYNIWMEPILTRVWGSLVYVFIHWFSWSYGCFHLHTYCALFMWKRHDSKHCNSSISISTDNRYDNRFIHLGRPIFTVNHNGDCVYTTDYTWDRACACYTREAPLTQSANWVSDHHYSTTRLSYCSVNPLRLQ